MTKPKKSVREQLAQKALIGFDSRPAQPPRVMVGQGPPEVKPTS
jgi:hypothetical protein